MSTLTATPTAKKITLSTIKSFIRKNRENLMIKVEMSFNGMTDMCEAIKGAQFEKITEDNTASLSEQYKERTQGINGVWFVGQSRDYFTAFENETMVGYEVYNCCRSFILAIPK